MAIMKRICAEVGSSHPAGRKTGSSEVVCPHCHCQTRAALVDGKRVCALCGKALRN